MAKKTNVTINGIDYYRLRKTIGKDKEGKPIIKPFYGSSKSDAEKKYDDWKLRRSQGLRIDKATSLTQSIFIWLWNVEKMSGNKSKTFERYEGLYRNHIDGSDLGFMLLDEVDKIAIIQHYTAMQNNDKTYSQIFNTHKVIRKFFIYCLSEGHVTTNPCFGLTLDAYKEDNELIIEEELKDEGEIETYLPGEIEKIVKGDYSRKLQIMAKFALGTGLREGELLALNISDVDIKNMMVNVTKTTTLMKVFKSPTEHSYKLTVTKPKNKSSVRKVPIPAELKKGLIEMGKIRAKEKIRLGEAYKENNLLFPSETGTYIYHRNLLHSWERALKRITVPYKKFHSLRHTYATQLIEKGVPLVTVSRLLGHASIKTTERYVHILEETKFDEVQKLNALFL